MVMKKLISFSVFVIIVVLSLVAKSSHAMPADAVCLRHLTSINQDVQLFATREPTMNVCSYRQHVSTARQGEQPVER